MSTEKESRELIDEIINIKIILLRNKALDEKHNWITNLSLGLLGFYIAMLIQLKIEGQINYPTYSMISCLLTTISAGLGFHIKLSRKNLTYDRMKFDMYMQHLDEILKIPDIEKSEKYDAISNKEVFKDMKQKATEYPYKIAKWQIYFFLIAVLMIVYYLMDFIFGMGVLPVYELVS